MNKMIDAIKDTIRICSMQLYYSYRRQIKEHKAVFFSFIFLYFMLLLFAFAAIEFIKNLIGQAYFTEFCVTFYYAIFFVVPISLFISSVFKTSKIYSAFKELEIFISLPVKPVSVFLSYSIIKSFRIFLVILLLLPFGVVLYHTAEWSIPALLFITLMIFILYMLVYAFCTYGFIKIVNSSIGSAVNIFTSVLLILLELLLLSPFFLGTDIRNIPVISNALGFIIRSSEHFTIQRGILFFLLTAIIAVLLMVFLSLLESEFYKGIEAANQKSSTSNARGIVKNVFNFFNYKFNYQIYLFIYKEIIELRRAREVTHTMLYSLLFLITLMFVSSSENVQMQPSHLISFVGMSVFISILVLYTILILNLQSEPKTFWLIKTLPINYRYFAVSKIFTSSLTIAPCFVIGILAGFITEPHTLLTILISVIFSIILIFSLSTVFVSLYLLIFEPNKGIEGFNKMPPLKYLFLAFIFTSTIILFNLILFFIGLKFLYLVFVNLIIFFTLSIILLNYSIHRVEKLENT